MSIFISSPAMSSTTRNSIMELQSNVSRLQKEISSGELEDVGLSLGSGTSELATLRQKQTWQDAVKGTNAMASSILDLSQSSLKSVGGNAQSFLDQLIGAFQSNLDPSIIAGSARSNLDSLTGQVNSQIAGVYIFGGDNSANVPLAGYHTPAAVARTAIGNAFSSAFGMTQGSASTSTITSSQMQTFLDGTFANEFSDANWAANWSSASSSVTSLQVSGSTTVDVGASANEMPFRQLAMAYTMVSDLGLGSLNAGTRQVVLEKASSLTSAALSGISSMQSRIGISQERIKSSGTDLETEGNIISERLAKLVQVDLYTASTEITALMTQLQASYSVTVQMQKLSILNYL